MSSKKAEWITATVTEIFEQIGSIEVLYPGLCDDGDWPADTAEYSASRARAHMRAALVGAAEDRELTLREYLAGVRNGLISDVVELHGLRRCGNPLPGPDA